MKLSLLKDKFELNDRNEKIQFCLLLLVSILVRIFCMNILSLDIRNFLLPWYNELSSKDLLTALRTQVGDCNLTYQLFIFIITRLPGEAIYKIKIFSCIFDYALAFGVYNWLREFADKRRAMIGFWLALFLPTIWLNSAAWGQCDSIYVCFIIWSLYMLHKNEITKSFILLGFAFVFKLQSVFILPFFCYYYWSRRNDANRIIRISHFCLIPLAMLVTSLPQFFAGRSLVETFAVYTHQTNEYHFMYMNYPSFWALLSEDYATDSRYAIVITAIVLLSLMYWFRKCKAKVEGKHFLWIAFILSYTCVLFCPAMHERYGFLYEVLAIPLVLSVGRGWLLLAGLQLLSLKTYTFYLCRAGASLQFLSWINLAIYITVLVAFHKELNNELSPSTLFVRNEEASFDNGSLRNSHLVVSKFDCKIMALLTIIFVIIGSFRLGTHNAPETFCNLGTDKGLNHEVIITFPNEEDIEALYIYTGIPAKQPINVYVADGKNWKLITKTQLKSVFAWNKVEVNALSRQVCLIFPSKHAMVGEVICLKKNKKMNNGIIEPIIRPQYKHFPELFDEQHCFQYPPTYCNQTMYDEVYHARTAYEFLHKMPIYENTHPPLGKIIISIGIALFGMNPFGYRIMCLIFGALMIPVMYLFALRMTRKTGFATLATVLLVTEFMHYTLSRIATVDVIVAFFILCMFYTIYAFVQEGKEKYLLLSGLASACGVATKWTAVYALLALAIIIAIYVFETYGKLKDIKTNSKPFIKFAEKFFVCFCLLPAAIYVISYIPFTNAYPDKGLIGHAISNSISMWNYHSHLVDTHFYASPWYSWLVDWKPLLDSYTTIAETNKSAVSTFVNPLVCFLGLATLLHHFYLTFKKKNKTATDLVICYIAMLAPWIFITRLAFIYQYFYCTHILILMICHSIYSLNFKNEEKIIKIVGAVSVGLFIMFFPVISGTVVNNYYVDQVLKWLPSWVF